MLGFTAHTAKRVGLLLSCFALWSCSSVNLEQYADNRPTLVTEDFFNGQLSAHGIVKNRSGEVIRYFNADITASWQDGIGTLDEDFVFDDGEQQKRIWTLTPHPETGYIATANDVTGRGHLRTAGNALFMQYTLQVPYKGRIIDVNVDDRMYLTQPNVLMNESILSKFGVEVGSVTLVILKNKRP